MTTEATETVVRRPHPKRANGTGRGGKRSFDIDDVLWARGIRAAHQRGVSLASVIRQAIDDFATEVEADPKR